MTPKPAPARVLVALLALGCSIELRGGAPATGGAAGSGGNVFGGFGGVGGDGAGAGAGGVAGTAPTTCAAGFQCVPELPEQWGYAFVSVAPYSETQPGPKCPDGADPQPFFSDPAGGGSCVPCDCGPIQGGACTVPLVCGYNSTCASFQDFTKTNGDCNGQTGGPTLSCMLGGPTMTTPGTCTPSGGTPAPMNSWKLRADLCPTKSSASCGTGSACVPLGSDVYASSICIYLPGEHGCPSDWPTATLIFQKALDQRKCSECTCVPGAVTCSAEYEFYDDGLCAGGGKKVSSTTCTDVSDKINDFWPGWGYRRTKAPVLGGGCTPGGGIPSGSISGDPNTAITVCCRKTG